MVVQCLHQFLNALQFLLLLLLLVALHQKFGHHVPLLVEFLLLEKFLVQFVLHDESCLQFLQSLQLMVVLPQLHPQNLDVLLSRASWLLFSV